MRWIRVISLLVVMIVFLSGGSSAFADNDVSRAYDEALNAMKRGNYAEAVDKLADISFYQDSAQLSIYCQAHVKAAAGDYDSAVEEMQRLGDYRDAEKCAAYFTARKYESEADSFRQKAYVADYYDQDMLHGFRDASKRALALRQSVYKEGVKEQKNENWGEAARYFDMLGTYEDSLTRCSYCIGRAYENLAADSAVSFASAFNAYRKAGAYLDSEKRKEQMLTAALEKLDSLIEAKAFDTAEEICRELDSFCDENRIKSLQKAKEAYAQELMREAEKLIAQGNLAEAEKIIDDLGDLCDADLKRKLQTAKSEAEKKAKREAEEAAHREKLAEAEKLMDQGLFDQAREIYKKINEPQMLSEVTYREAQYLAVQGKTEKGAGLYLQILAYKDSRDRHYRLGKELVEKDPETASRILLSDRDYPGAEQDLYEIALKASEEKNYALSTAIYSELAGKRDCSLRLTNDLYLYGLQLMNEGQPERAAAIFDGLDGVGSSDLHEKKARYAAAEKLQAMGRYEGAAKAFQAIADYTDARARATECTYALAQQKKAKKEYADAAKVFETLNNYKDSQEQVLSCKYLQAMTCMSNSQWKEAAELFHQLGEYQESSKLYLESNRQLGNQKLTEGSPEEAYAAFLTADDTNGQAHAAFAAGEAQMAAMSTGEALKWYQLASSLPETEERVAMIAQSFFNLEEDELSEAFASIAVNSDQCQSVLYALAVRSLERKDEQAAMRQLKKAGDNADANEKFQKMLNASIDSLVKQKRYDDAIYMCSTYGEQERMEYVVALKTQQEEAEHQAKLAEAGQLLELQKYEEAIAAYTALGETELAAKAAEAKTAAEEKARLEAEKAQAEKEAAETAARLEAEKAQAEKEAAETAARLEAEKERIRARENEAASLLQAGQFDDALIIYQELNEPEMVKEVIYQKAAGENLPGLYLQIIDYKDSREQHYLAGKALQDTDPQRAFEILAEDIAYSDVQSVLYDLANRESKAGHFALSADMFRKLAEQPMDPQNMRADCNMHYIQDLYQYGLQLQTNQEWTAAADVFDQISGIGEAKAHAVECRYLAAAALEESGKYNQAALAFDEVGNYRDSQYRASQNRYQVAQALLDKGYLEDALKAFSELKEFGDAAQKAKECRYRMADILLKAEQYEEAREKFAELGSYSDSRTRMMECVYRIAAGHMENSRYPDAVSMLETIRGYKDTQDMLNVCHESIAAGWIEKAESLLRNKQTSEAVSAYEAAREEYGKTGNREKMEELALTIADCYYSLNDADAALKWCRLAGEKGKTRIQEIAEFYYLTEQYGLAKELAGATTADTEKQVPHGMDGQNAASEDEAAAEAAARLEAARERLRARENEAASLLQAGQYDDALSIYQELNEPEMVNEVIYQKAAGEKLPGLYLQIIDYKDSREQHYLAGKALLDTDPQKAFEILAGDIAYSDVQSVLYDLANRESKAEHFALSAYMFRKLSEQPLDPQNMRADCHMHYVQDLYQYGLQLKSNQEWTAAASIFDQLTEVGEAKAHALECRYQAAAALEESGKHDQAALAFDALGNYSDSKNRASQNRYQVAQELLAKGNLEDALKAFSALKPFGDSSQKVLECRYRIADALMKAEKYDDALAKFAELGTYSDSVIKKKECSYQIAAAHMESFRYSEAVSILETISSYKNAQDMLNDCHESIAAGWIEKAESLLRNKQTLEAVSAYKSAREEYGKTENSRRMEELALSIADCYYSLGDITTALKWCKSAGEKGAARMAEIAEFYYLTEQYRKAEEIAIVSHSDGGKEILYRIGEQKQSSGDEEAAIRLFEEAGDYSDAKYRHDTIIYQQANRNIENHGYISALKLLDTIQGYEGAEEKKKEALIALALSTKKTDGMNSKSIETVWNARAVYVQELMNNKQYHEALEFLNGLGKKDKEDSRAGELLWSTRSVYVRDLMDQKQYTEAIKYLESMDREDRADPRGSEMLWSARTVYVQELMDQKQYAEAIKYLEGMEKADRADPKAIEMLWKVRSFRVNELVEKQEYKEALTLLENVVQADRNDKKAAALLWDIRLAYAHEMIDNQQPVAAMDFLAGIVKADKENRSEAEQKAADLLWDTRFTYVQSLIDQLQYKDAVAFLEGIVPATIDNAEEEEVKAAELLWNTKIAYAQDYINKHQYEEAIALLKAMEQKTEIAEMLNRANYLYAESIEGSGKYEEAAAYFTALGEYQDSAARAVNARYLQALSYMENKEYDRAILTFGIHPDYRDTGDQIKECQYLKAKSLISEKQYLEAFGILQTILEYKDVKDNLLKDSKLEKAVADWQHSVSAESKLYFGHDKNGKPFKWVVLDRDGDYLLLITTDIIDRVPFMEGNPGRTTWNHSTLRKYLNGAFMSSAFDEQEKAAIRLSKVKAVRGLGAQASPGNDTEDYVYVLNQQEADKYIVILGNNEASESWWLRSPYGNNSRENTIKLFEKADRRTVKVSYDASNSVHGLRPVLWVRDNVFLKLAED